MLAPLNVCSGTLSHSWFQQCNSWSGDVAECGESELSVVSVEPTRWDEQLQADSAPAFWSFSL